MPKKLLQQYPILKKKIFEKKKKKNKKKNKQKNNGLKKTQKKMSCTSTMQYRVYSSHTALQHLTTVDL
jgi:hypothetical protein